MTRKNKLKIVGQIALVVAAIGLVYLIVMLIDRRIGLFDGDDDDVSYEEEVLPIMIEDQEYELAHDVSSYLIMGTDASGMEELDRMNYEGSMADFLLVVMVDDTDETYSFIQLNRDTMTKVPLLQKDGTSFASANIQLCCAHWYGGTKRESCKNTVRTVSMLLRGIPIDGYYAMKMDALPQLNHAVGGVTVTIEDDFSNVDASMKQGETITLTDDQAYTYVRSRGGMEDDTNEARMRRHQTFMNALMEQVKEQATNEKYVAKLYEELQDYATTDMGSKTMTNLAKRIHGYKYLGLFTLEGETTVGKALQDDIEHAEFYVDEEKLDEMVLSIYPLKAIED